jgi:hypothetical protein
LPRADYEDTFIGAIFVKERFAFAKKSLESNFLETIQSALIEIAKCPQGAKLALIALTFRANIDRKGQRKPRAMGEFGPNAANYSTLAAIGFKSDQETVSTGQVA